MKKVNSLILLVNSLSKPEKKSLYLYSDHTQGPKIYMELFRMIENQKIKNGELLQERFKQKYSSASFYAEVKYLYEFILTVLTRLRANQDPKFRLYQKYLHTQILYERNLDQDFYDSIQKLQVEAEETSDYDLLLILQQSELDYYQKKGFIGISEQLLLRKQHKRDSTIKIIRQISEQSSLYELLLLRIEQTPPSKIKSQNRFLNDLVVSEISLSSNLNKNIFEIRKIHQLFQTTYLNSTGDHKAALNSYIELNKLLESTPTKSNDIRYYSAVLEGILESLRGNRYFRQMSYFLDKLRSLQCPSLFQQTEVNCIWFIYSVSVLIAEEKYNECLYITNQWTDVLLKKMNILTPYRQLSLSLTLTIIYLLNKEIRMARKQLSTIVNNESYTSFGLFRPAQLIQLIICYESRDFELQASLIRAIKRQNKIAKRKLEIESVLFYFLSIDFISLDHDKKQRIKIKLTKKLSEIQHNQESRGLLDIFRFDQWILSHLERQ